MLWTKLMKKFVRLVMEVTNKWFVMLWLIQICSNSKSKKIEIEHQSEMVGAFIMQNWMRLHCFSSLMGMWSVSDMCFITVLSADRETRARPMRILKRYSQKRLPLRLHLFQLEWWRRRLVMNRILCLLISYSKFTLPLSKKYWNFLVGDV